MGLPAYTQIFVALAASQLLFLVLYLELRHRKFLVARLISCWSLCVICYLIASTPGVLENGNSLPAFFLRRAATLTTPLLWFISYYLFVDRHDIRPIVWIIAAYYFLTRTIAGVMGYLEYPFIPQTYVFTHLINEAIRFGFVSHAMYMATRGYAGDLSLHRRNLRIGFVLIMSLVLVATVFNHSYLMLLNFLEALRSPENPEIPFLALSEAPIPILSFSVYLYLASLLFMLWQFWIPEDQAPALFGAAHQFDVDPAAESELNQAQSILIDQIRRAMEVDKLYRRHRLAVHDLADHVASREYKVREAINNHMGFRNFSDFLNNYRVVDAAERLRDSEEKISFIGLDVGYISQSSFHKAFKEKFDATPKEYRMQNQTGH